MQNMGERLRHIRQVKGWTQKQIAARLRVSEQAVSRWERGEGYPDITLLPSLAALFGTTTDRLLGMDREAREAKRVSIRVEIEKRAAEGTPSTEESVTEARVWAAEFPEEEDILAYYAGELSLAWERTLDSDEIRRDCAEAERIYKLLYDMAATEEDRCRRIAQLAELYLFGLGDRARAKEMVAALPSERWCREHWERAWRQALNGEV